MTSQTRLKRSAILVEGMPIRAGFFKEWAAEEQGELSPIYGLPGMGGPSTPHGKDGKKPGEKKVSYFPPISPRG